MILQLDIGNTRVKWRLKVAQTVPEQGVLVRADDGLLPALAQAPDQVWISSAAGADLEQDLAARIRDWWSIDPWFARTAATACGIINSYAEPARMGVDRWLAMLAAWHAASAPLR